MIDQDKQTAQKNQFEQVEHQGANEQNNEQNIQQQSTENKQEKSGKKEKFRGDEYDSSPSSQREPSVQIVNDSEFSSPRKLEDSTLSFTQFQSKPNNEFKIITMSTNDYQINLNKGIKLKKSEKHRNNNHTNSGHLTGSIKNKLILNEEQMNNTIKQASVSCFEQETEYKQMEEELKTPHSIAMPKIITVLDTEEEHGHQSEEEQEDEYCDTIMDIQNQIIYNDSQKTRNFARTVIDIIKPGKQSVTYQTKNDVQVSGGGRNHSSSSQNSEIQPNQAPISNIDKSSFDNQSQQIIIKNQSLKILKQNKQSEANFQKQGKNIKEYQSKKSVDSNAKINRQSADGNLKNITYKNNNSIISMNSQNSTQQNIQNISSSKTKTQNLVMKKQQSLNQLNTDKMQKQVNQNSINDNQFRNSFSNTSNTNSQQKIQQTQKKARDHIAPKDPSNLKRTTTQKVLQKNSQLTSALSHQSSVVEVQQLHPQFRFDQQKDGQKSRNQKSFKLLSQDIYQNAENTIIQSIQTIDSQNLDYSYKNQQYSPQILVKKQSSNMNEEISFNEVNNSHVGISQSDCKLPVISISDFDVDKQNYQLSHQSVSKFKSSQKPIMDDDTQKSPFINLYQFNDNGSHFLSSNDDKSCIQLRQNSKNNNEQIGPIFTNNSLDSNSNNIKVVIRIRPFNNRENEDPNKRSIVEIENEGTIVLLDKSGSLGANQEMKRFYFDFIGHENIDQKTIFNTIAKPIANSCLQGYNGTIFAYGQTGAGKTFTIQGPSLQAYISNENLEKNEQNSNSQEQSHQDLDKDRGIMQRSFEYIFQCIQEEKQQVQIKENGAALEFLVKCSFLEIYNEQIMDLLEPSSIDLRIREDINKGVYVEGLAEEIVSSHQDMIALINHGVKNRHVGATNLNIQSSRSHSVLTTIIESKSRSATGVWNVKQSRFHIIDLAGSERQKIANTVGDRLKEAGMINKSLSSLGNVINSLVDVSEGKNRHVPYRDSKLTFILRDSLGGNSKTAIIANISPSHLNLNETLSTLKFAQRAKLIKNKAVINEDSSGTLMLLKNEIKKLKKELSDQQKQVSILQNNCHLLQQNENLQTTAHLKKEEIKLTNKICKMCKKEIQNQLEDMNGDEDVNELDISIEDRNQKTNELVYSQSAENNEDKSIDPFSPDRNSLLNIKLKTQGMQLGRLSTPRQASSNANILDLQLVKKYQNRILTLENLLQSKLFNLTQNQNDQKKIMFVGKKLESQVQLYDGEVVSLKSKIQELESNLRKSQEKTENFDENMNEIKKSSDNLEQISKEIKNILQIQINQEEKDDYIKIIEDLNDYISSKCSQQAYINLEKELNLLKEENKCMISEHTEKEQRLKESCDEMQNQLDMKTEDCIKLEEDSERITRQFARVKVELQDYISQIQRYEETFKSKDFYISQLVAQKEESYRLQSLKIEEMQSKFIIDIQQAQSQINELQLKIESQDVFISDSRVQEERLEMVNNDILCQFVAYQTRSDHDLQILQNFNNDLNEEFQKKQINNQLQSLKIQEVEDVLIKLKESNSDFSQKMNELEEQLSQQVRINTDVKNEKNQLIEQINSLKLQIEDQSRQITEQKQLIENLDVKHQTELDKKNKQFENEIQKSKILIEQLNQSQESIQDFSNQVDNLIKEKDELQFIIDYKHQEIIQLKNQLQILQDNHESEMKSANEQHQIQIKELKQLNLNEQESNQKKELQQQNLHNKQVQELKAEIETKNQETRSRILETECKQFELQEFKQELEKVKNAHERSQQETQLAQKSLESVRMHVKEQESLIQKQKEQIVKSREDLAEKEKMYQSIKQQLVQSQQDTEKKINRMTLQLQEAQFIQQEYDFCQNQLNSAFQIEKQKQLDDLNVQISKLQNQNEEQILQINRQVQDIKELQIQNQKLVDEHSSLQSKFENYQKEKEETQDCNNNLLNQIHILQQNTQSQTQEIQDLKLEQQQKEQEQKLAFDKIMEEQRIIMMNELQIQKEEISDKTEIINQLQLQISDKIQKQLELKDIMDQKDKLFQEFQISEQLKQNELSQQIQNLEVQVIQKDKEANEQINKLQKEIKNKSISLEGQSKLIEKQQEQIDQVNSKIKDLINQLDLSQTENEIKNIEILKVQKDQQILHLSLQEQQSLSLNKDNQIINLSIDIQNLKKQNLEYQTLQLNTENILNELNQQMEKLKNQNSVLSQNLTQSTKNEKDLQLKLITTQEQQEKINQLNQEQKLIMESKQQAQIQSLELQIQQIQEANYLETEKYKNQIILIENEISKLQENFQIQNIEHQEQLQNQQIQQKQNINQQQMEHEQLILNLKEKFNLDIQNMKSNHDLILSQKNQEINSKQMETDQQLNQQKQYLSEIEQNFSKEKQILLKEQFQKQQKYLNEIDEMQDNQKQLNKKILNLQTAIDIIKTNIDKKAELMKNTVNQEKEQNGDVSAILEEMEIIDETISSAIIFERGMGTGHAESSGDSNSFKSESNFNEDVIVSTNLNLSVTSIIQSISKILQKQIVSLKEKMKSKEKECSEVVGKHEQLQSKYEILYQKHDQISNSYSKTEKELQELKQKDQKLAEKLKEKEQEVAKTQRHKNEFYEKMKEKEKEIEKQKSRIEQMQQKKEKIEQQFNKELDQKQKIINELDNYKLYLPEAENLLQKVNKMHQKSQKDYEILCKYQQEEEERHLQEKQQLENLIIDLQNQIQTEKQKQIINSDNESKDDGLNILKNQLEEQNILIINLKQTIQNLQDDIFEKENQISQIQDQINQIMQNYDSREIEIKELVKTLKNFKEENSLILAERDQLIEEIELLQSNQNNCFKIQAHLKMKEENAKCRKDVIELQKQVQRLKKDPRAYETCNCNESAAKLKKQFRTLISHILSLIQIDYIIQEEGLKIEQLNEDDVFFVADQFQALIDLMSYIDSKIFSLRHKNLAQASRTVIIPPTTKSACTQILEKYHSSSRIINKGSVQQAFGQGEATNISQTDNSIVNGGIHLPHQDNLMIQHFQERRDGYFKQSCVKDNSFIIESTEQINTQRRINDNTVICLPQDVRECVSKQQFQILTTGGNSETAMKKNHDKSYESIEEVYTDGRLACSNSVENLNKDNLSNDILVQNMGHSIINKNQERLKDSQNSQMKNIHQKSLDSPIILNSYSSLYINKNNNNFNKDFFKNNNQISARRVYSDQKQIEQKNNIPNQKMRELEKQRSNDVKQLPNTSQMTNSFNANNKFTVSNLSITQDNQQQIVNIQAQKLTQNVPSKFIKNPAIILQKNDFQIDKQMEIRFNFDQNLEGRKLNSQNITDTKMDQGKKTIKKANVIEFQRRLSQQNIISKRIQQKQIQVKPNKNEKSLEGTSLPQSSVINAMKRQNSANQ